MNAPVSKTGMGGSVHRGFESLPLRCGRSRLAVRSGLTSWVAGLWWLDPVLGYWEQLFHDDPSELQQEIEATMASIDAPCLSVFGHDLSASEREYLQERVSDLQIEEWPNRGHLVHLAEHDRFAARLRSFIEHCRTSGERPRIGHDQREDTQCKT